MRTRFSRRAAPGQAIPLIALLIVVLIGVVALSVDVGNTYAQQRNTVRATNAAALAGMDAMIRNSTDQSIGLIIQQSLSSNGINGVYGDSETQTNGDIIQAFYMDAKGNHLASCNVGSCGSIPLGATYIEVDVEGTVNTYFAKVVNRPTLPVNAQAFAGRCSPVSGVYPIGVQLDSFGSDGKFKQPTTNPPSANDYYGTFTNSVYPLGISERRIFLTTTSPGEGNFSWLRWLAATGGTDATALNTSLQGSGNLELGFDEGLITSGTVRWPAATQAPDGYPIKPHEINSNDWAYSNNTTSWATVKNTLQYHIDNQTVMILPIVDDNVVGSSPNQVYQVTGLGAFYLRGIPGYTKDTGVAVPTNIGNFLDLAYIGPANSVACLSTPAVVKNQLGILGSVYIKPGWGKLQTQKPIAYQIIMDVSGSMSWNFLGQGYSGGVQQCEATAANPNAVSCGGGYDNPWPTTSERRVYVLKNAIAGTNGFIESMKANDTMSVTAFSTSGVTTSGWTGNQTTLKSTVMNAGNYGSSQYLTSGGTNGPKAIKTTSSYLKNTPPPASPDGQSYKNVVIYFTDGVANVFNDSGQTTNYAQDVCPQYHGDSRAINDATCQYDMTGYPTNSHGRRPISEMVYQAGLMKTAYPDMQFFTVALANVNPLGLDEIASSSSMLYRATDASLVPTVLEQIQDKVLGPCTEASYPDWTIRTIDANHTADSTLKPVLPSSVYGYIYLTDDQDVPVAVPWTGPGTDPRATGEKNKIPIIADAGGYLSYSVPASSGLAADDYRLRGFLYYKAYNADPTSGGDGISRQYSQIIKDGTPTSYISLHIDPSQLLGATQEVEPLHFKLDENIVKLCR